MDAKVNLIALKPELSMKLLKIIDSESRIHDVVFQTSIESSIVTGSHLQLTTKSNTGRSYEVDIFRSYDGESSYGTALKVSCHIINSEFESDKAAEDCAGLIYLLTFNSVRDKVLEIMKEASNMNI